MAGSAGSQAVTNMVCGRFCPDPLGIAVWFDKLEFGGLAAQPPLPPALVRGVPQCAHWGGGSPSYAYLKKHQEQNE